MYLCCFYFLKINFPFRILGTGHPLNFARHANGKLLFVLQWPHLLGPQHTRTHAASPNGVKHALALIIPK